MSEWTTVTKKKYTRKTQSDAKKPVYYTTDTDRPAVRRKKPATSQSTKKSNVGGGDTALRCIIFKLKLIS